MGTPKGTYLVLSTTNSNSVTLTAESIEREKIGQTGARTWDSLNLVRVRYQPVVGNHQL